MQCGQRLQLAMYPPSSSDAHQILLLHILEVALVGIGCVLNICKEVYMSIRLLCELIARNLLDSSCRTVVSLRLPFHN